MKWDGHTHTHFCRHGSAALMEQYVERAIELQFERYTISEHPPVPANWIDDPAIMDSLAMDAEEMPAYLDYAERVKARYDGQIEVAVGLELDYLYEAESFTEAIIGEYGDRLEDALISVHYLPGKGGMRCIDFSTDDVRRNLLAYYGSMEKLVDEYYNHVELAIASAARWPMRKRLGHITLIEKFWQELPPIDEGQTQQRLRAMLPKLQAAGLGIDANMAGLRKNACQKPYVPHWFARECQEHGIPCIYGSDAHKPAEVGAGWQEYTALVGDEQ